MAEASGNHNGNIYTAIAMVEQAKHAGADAIKFQAYTPDTITLNHDGPGFILRGGQWDGQKLYDLYAKAHTPFHWFPTLFAHARYLGITPFASVFDPSSVDMLEGLNCPIYKIASFELVDIPLIRYTANTGKPMILSTGMATDKEVAEADDVLPSDYPHIFLHCVSGYPTPLGEANLSGLAHLREVTQLPVGFSDHTLGADAGVMATALGAWVIEKHFTLERAAGGPDAAFSMEPAELKDFVVRIKAAWEACQPTTRPSETPQHAARRSLYVVKDICAGDLISGENVRSIRPAYGLPPRFWDAVVGRHARRDIARGTPLSLDDLEGSG